jgi:hypothetical protein
MRCWPCASAPGAQSAAIITADYSDESVQLFQELQLPMLNKPVKPAKLRALLSHLLRDRVG